MLKILLCILIVAGCGYVGFGVSLYYKKREKFFSDFTDFLNHAKTQISFFQSRLRDVFSSFSCSSDLAKILSTLSARAGGEAVEEVKKPIYLKENEWVWIYGFLTSLGKCDTEREIDNILAIFEKAQSTLATCQKEAVKKGAAATKLGITLGLAIAIIVA